MASSERVKCYHCGETFCSAGSRKKKYCSVICARRAGKMQAYHKFKDGANAAPARKKTKQFRCHKCGGKNLQKTCFACLADEKAELRIRMTRDLIRAGYYVNFAND